MSHAFAKDSRACAVCLSWGGERALAPDHTLVHVARYSVEGECRTAVSEDYRKITRAGHTCGAWAPLPMMKAHGARSSRTPGPSAAMTGVLAAAATARPAESPPAASAVAADDTVCAAVSLDIDKAPPQARVLFMHWRRVKGQRPLPAAHDIDTAQIRDAVPRLSLFVPGGGGPSGGPDGGFVYRTCGRAVQRRLALHAPGRALADCHPPEAAARLGADLARCLSGGEPLCHTVRNDPLVPGTRFVEVLLPLADADGRAAFVLAYRHVPGG